MVLVVLAILSGLAVTPGAALGKEADPPRIDARGWILVDGLSGEVLAARNPDRRLPMASTTKLMTAYLAIRRLPPGEVVRAPRYDGDPVESLMGLEAGQAVSVRDLLYGLVLLSGNDAAVTLARAVSGSVPRFVVLMNRTARRLGLEHTGYRNPVGLDAPGHQSSARDLARLSMILMDMPRFRRIAGSRSARLTSYDPPVEIESTNDFLLANPWATGIKTGHTLKAGYLLTSAGVRNGAELIGVVAGAPTEGARDSGTMELMDYGATFYRPRRPLVEDRKAASVPIRFRSDPLSVVPARTVEVGLRRESRLTETFVLPNEVEGPIRRGARMGMATIRIDGRRVARVQLLAATMVSAPTAIEEVRGFLDSNRLPIAIALSVIILLALLVARGRKRKVRDRMRRLRRSGQ